MPVYTIKTPQNTVTLEDGAKVISADDRHVGSIEQLVVDSLDNRVSHFIIGEGLLFNKENRLPVKSGTLERLPANHPV